MNITHCRVCAGTLFKEPLIRYDNMPKASQFLPNARSLKNDKGIDLAVCQCASCGLVQLNTHPVSYYKDVIRATSFSEEMKKFRLRQFHDFILHYNLKGKKIIEIGCGRGEYLSIMDKCNVQAYGIEHRQSSVLQCKKNNLNVIQGFLPHNIPLLKESPFDAFYFLNFLEHLPQPNATLNGILNIITDDAVGLIEVPNFDMILRDNLFSEFTSDHLFYFTKETLTGTITHCGFDVLECNPIWYNYILSAVVKKRQKLNLSRFFKYQTNLTREINTYIDHFRPKKVAIWGAGHQALAILALTKISNKISYVIDSARFKQGKYTPATHLPIVPADMLDKNPPDAVIIAAGGYSDEVANVLQKKFSKRISVAVIRGFHLKIINNK